MLRTRFAVAADEDRVLALLAQLIEEEPGRSRGRAAAFRRLLEGDRGIVLVAEDGSALLGVITVSFNLAVRFEHGYAQIEELIVDAEARGKNAGALLVQAAIAAARDQGCEEIGLYSREQTRGFYEKLGFRYAGPELRQALAE